MFVIFHGTLAGNGGHDEDPQIFWFDPSCQIPKRPILSQDMAKNVENKQVRGSNIGGGRLLEVGVYWRYYGSCKTVNEVQKVSL